MNLGNLFVIVLCISEILCKYLHERGESHFGKRHKRFAIPTPRMSMGFPFPVPTLPGQTTTPYPIPALPILDKYAVYNGSRVVDCPLTRGKRSTDYDGHLRELLEVAGGRIHPNFMAVTREEAKKQFPNLLPLALPDESDNKETSQIITKEQISQDVRKWNSYLKSLLRSANSFAQHGIERTMLSTFLRERNLTLNVGAKPAAARELGEFLVNQGNVTSIRHLMHQSNITVHPKVLQSLTAVRRRHKRYNQDFPKTEVQYCVNKGVQQPDGFIALCTACGVTTTLSKTSFPRQINEVVCGGPKRDWTCLTLQNTPHGACKQTSLQMTFLRQVPGGCRMMVKDKGQITVQEWETYIQPVRTGCTCAMNKVSRIANQFFPNLVGR